MKPLTQLFNVRHKVSTSRPAGVIDIGSNSVRLVVYESAARFLTPIFNEKVLCGLGRAVATTGRLDPDAIDCALQALSRFRAIAAILKTGDLRAIATAAARDAANGADFIERAEEVCGVPIEVLTGETEARLAAHGVMMGHPKPDGVAGDLGGGSLELIDISGREVSRATTLALGGLRLLDSSDQKIDKIVPAVDAEFAQAPWISKGRGRAFYAIGGTWRALARLHMAETNYPLRVIDGYAIPAAEALDFCEGIRKGKKSGSARLDVVPKARRDILPYGALVMERFLSLAGPSHVEFSASGIRDGLIYSRLSPREKAQDPLLAFCEDWAKRRARSYRHAAELQDWTGDVFTGLDAGETEEERRVRRAACLLSDTAWQTHPDYRGEQSFTLIAHSALSGVDHPGRIFLALAVYYRNAGPGERGSGALVDDLAARLSKPALKRARVLGAAIRAAHMLSVGQAGVIPFTPVSYEGDLLVLSLPKAFASLDGERLRNRLAALAALLDRKPEVRFSA